MNLPEEVMKKHIIAIALTACFIFPALAFAGLPLQTVKGYADEVVHILRDPSIKTEAARRDKIRLISRKMFDFTELSKRTLSRNWRKLDPGQQKEFVNLYTSLLEDAYANKIMSYTDEEIIFNNEVTTSEETVEVESTVMRKSGDIQIYYRMMRKDGVWKVYDMVIEGVSLINNYRSQFKEILTNKDPEALLDILRKKVRKT